MGTPGNGVGQGSFPYPGPPSPPREMRLDARSWGSHHNLEVASTFACFTVSNDRAMMFLFRRRPARQALLTRP